MAYFSQRTTCPPHATSMDNTLDAHFCRRLSAIENSLLSLDSSNIDTFNSEMVTYTTDLKATLERNPESLSNSTITKAYILANRVHIVVQTFLELEELAEKLSASSLNTSPYPFASEELSPLSDLHEPALPSYIRPSYDWLVENIHNPYPTTSVRDTIAQKSRATRKDVDNWFIDARKRIGWNTTRKIHFSNKRVDIVDAATRFYADDEKLTLGQDVELAFISIMKNAKDLYSDKFGETPLASKLATVVKDLTPQTKAEAKAERMRQLQLKKDRDAYPSPDRSPEPTRLSPVPCDDEVNNDASLPISSTNRKRRSPSREPLDSEQSEEPRPAKRSRFDVPITPPAGITISIGLSSPAPSVDKPLQVVGSSTSLSPPSPTPVGSSRKRRLSESDGQGAPKRPRNIQAGLRLQAVSDPMSLASSNLLFEDSFFDGWFQQTFDLPEVDDISPSGFSVELGSLSDFDCDTPAETRSATPEYTEQVPEQAEQTFQPTTIEVVDIPPTDALWGDFDFGLAGNLLLPSESTTHSSPMFTVAGHEALPAPLAQDLANFENFYSLSDPAFSDALVIPLDLGSKTWDFEGSHDFVKHNEDLSVRTDFLPPYDFANGADLLPSPDPIYFPTLSQDNVRREKERQFREAFEKAQKLAFELRGEGIVI
ncbi:hypothetical protein C0991_001777 [Blastosporella zonata]|nr:hypothetical protein C0991_001777 [Blastosporella zonata]